MINKPYDLMVYIGRFEPFHIAHQETIRLADTLSKDVLVLIGSSETPRTIKNPWTEQERSQMILSATHVHNLHTGFIKDYLYDDNRWIEEVGKKIQECVTALNAKKVAIIGHDKDHSSFYLNFFPQWEFYSMSKFPGTGETIDSTKIRNLLFENEIHFIKSALPEEVYSRIIDDTSKDWFRDLISEYKFVKDYKSQWTNVPYPVIFNTADAVLVQSGHILLVERDGYPGKGLIAMPGGFVRENDSIKQTILKELREETRIKVPEKVLNGSIKDVRYYDSINRSTRGRTITHAFYMKLDDSVELPKIRGGSDAKRAFWLPLHELDAMRSVMFEDHWHIIYHMLGRN